MNRSEKIEKIKNVVLTIGSLFFTAWGFWLLVTGNITNGLLAFILGELIDIPKRRINF